MKNILTFTLILSGIAIAAPGDTVTEGSDAKLKNITLDERIYQQDGFGANWAFDAGSDGLWAVPKEKVIKGKSYTAPFKIRNGAASNTLVIGTNDDPALGTNSYVGIGTDTPTTNLDVQWSNKNTARDGTKYLVALSANNSEATKTSDAGFSLENKREGFKWEFRTHEPSGGFTATKALSGGAEFVVQNTTTNFRNAKMVVAGVTIFENGHLVTASSRKLKTDIQPLDAKAALDAFQKLQPVSYEYKAHKGEQVVGFIAEDIPDLVAMPSRSSLDSTEIVAVLTKVVQIQAEKIKKLEAMQKRLARVESLLTNLALKTSTEKQDKLSLNK